MKVKCTGYKSDERYFTVGKVYEWENGTLKDDNGYIYNSRMVGVNNPDKWVLSDWYTFEVVNEQKFNEDAVKSLSELYENNSTIMEDLLDLKRKIEMEGMTDEAKGRLFDLRLTFEDVSREIFGILTRAHYGA